MRDNLVRRCRTASRAADLKYRSTSSYKEKEFCLDLFVFSLNLVGYAWKENTNKFQTLDAILFVSTSPYKITIAIYRKNNMKRYTAIRIYDIFH